MLSRSGTLQALWPSLAASIATQPHLSRSVLARDGRGIAVMHFRMLDLADMTLAEEVRSCLTRARINSNWGSTWMHLRLPRISEALAPWTECFCYPRRPGCKKLKGIARIHVLHRSFGGGGGVSQTSNALTYGEEIYNGGQKRNLVVGEARRDNDI